MKKKTKQNKTTNCLCCSPLWRTKTIKFVLHTIVSTAEQTLLQIQRSCIRRYLVTLCNLSSEGMVFFSFFFILLILLFLLCKQLQWIRGGAAFPLCMLRLGNSARAVGTIINMSSVVLVRCFLTFSPTHILKGCQSNSGWREQTKANNATVCSYM